jgi:hypothetical protein
MTEPKTETVSDRPQHARIAPSTTQIERLERSLEQSTQAMLDSAGVRLSSRSEHPQDVQD